MDDADAPAYYDNKHDADKDDGDTHGHNPYAHANVVAKVDAVVMADVTPEKGEAAAVDEVAAGHECRL